MMMAGRIGYRLSSLLLALNKGATHASRGQAREGCPGSTVSGRMPAQKEKTCD
jgi:hypothetical protein